MQPRMRLLSPLFLAALAAGFAVLQDPAEQDEQDSNREPYIAFLESEHARLTKGLEGSWMLASMSSATEFIEVEDFRGFAQFREGYLALMLMGAEDEEVLFGTETIYTVLTGAYRYQVSEDHRLQLASVLGIDNAEGGFLFHRSGDPREMELSLVEDDLSLWEPGGDRYEFRRLGPTGFPIEAADRLREKRTGVEFDEE